MQMEVGIATMATTIAHHLPAGSQRGCPGKRERAAPAGWGLVALQVLQAGNGCLARHNGATLEQAR